jgi:DNA (cytosine-5)-methyltransferase 1
VLCYRERTRFCGHGSASAHRSAGIISTVVEAEYVKLLRAELPRPVGGSPMVLDLFAGCGGLALGFEAAGFETLGFEVNEAAAATYQKNLAGDCVVEMLHPKFDFPDADIVIGGPPCQPFSVGGRQEGHRDDRNGFPAFLAAVDQLRPSHFVIENVRGMLYRNRPYLDEVLRAGRSMGYNVTFTVLNAKYFGVPQNRERVIIVGSLQPFVFPKPDPRVIAAGEAIGDLASTAPAGSRLLTPSQDAYVAKYEKASQCKNPRDLHMDRPARTLTCRNLAGATGDMQRVRLPDGRRRRLLPREAARLQSFPDWFEFVGSESAVFEQIGNAVPPLFAKRIAEAVMSSFEGVTTDDDALPAQPRMFDPDGLA